MGARIGGSLTLEFFLASFIPRDHYNGLAYDIGKTTVGSASEPVNGEGGFRVC